MVCAPGYARAHRVWHDKAGTLAKYHIAPSQAALYEDHDLIPVCLGGDNASPLNHWPQPNSTTPGATDKDMLEERICREVCRARDDALLARYQAAFAGTGPHCGALCGGASAAGCIRFREAGAGRNGDRRIEPALCGVCTPYRAPRPRRGSTYGLRGVFGLGRVFS